MRMAIARTGKSREVAQYLPNNFRCIGRTLDQSSDGGIIIIGVMTTAGHSTSTSYPDWDLQASIAKRSSSSMVSTCTSWNSISKSTRSSSHEKV